MQPGRSARLQEARAKHEEREEHDVSELSRDPISRLAYGIARTQQSDIELISARVCWTCQRAWSVGESLPPRPLGRQQSRMLRCSRASWNT